MEPRGPDLVAVAAAETPTAGRYAAALVPIGGMVEEGGTMHMDPAELRRVFGMFATGVTIVTARDPEGGYVGMTVNSFTSVSLDPPLVLWCLDRAAWSLPAFVGSGAYAVNVLAAGQEELSNRFARRGEDKFAGLEVTEGHGGAPLLPGCLAHLQCRLVDTHEAGDHLVLVGEVVEADASGGEPLLFFGGRYGRLA